jgi:hypothetical protein
MEQFARIYEIAWSALAICVGIGAAFYTDKTTDRQARGFERLYAKTGLILFKKYAEGMRTAYFWWLTKVIVIFFVAMGILLLFGFIKF